jgi:hypothetical protein
VITHGGVHDHAWFFIDDNHVIILEEDLQGNLLGDRLRGYSFRDQNRDTIAEYDRIARLDGLVVAQNELFDPGFCDTAEAFFKTIGLNVDPKTCVMDSTQIVFSNYFFAKPAFWRRWLEVNERIFYLCEEQSQFSAKIGLLKKTSYRDGVQRKVFLIERIASTLLVNEPHWQVGNYNTFLCAYSASRLNEFPGECQTADALKIAWNKTKNDFFVYEFHKLISSISSKLKSPQ